MYAIACYIGLVILAKYVYKFPQIQEILPIDTNSTRLLDDIGLQSDGEVSTLTDLLPDTVLLLMIVAIKRQRQDYQAEAKTMLTESRIVRESRHDLEFQAPRFTQIIWIWFAEQSKYGDFIAVATMFAMATFRVSAVHALYFFVGCLVCWTGHLPPILWWVIYCGTAAHMIAMYIFQFQLVDEKFQTCQTNVWAGFGPRIDSNTVYWELLAPLTAMFALDLHNRFDRNRKDHLGVDRDVLEIWGAMEVEPEAEIATEPEAEIATESEAEIGLTNSSESDRAAKNGCCAATEATWFRFWTFASEKCTLHNLGLETTYIILLIAVIHDANLMSIVYTLLIFICAVIKEPRNWILWAAFSVLFGSLLFFRYVVFLQMPPCETPIPIPINDELKKWLGLTNECILEATEAHTCAATGFSVDLAVLFITTAYARVCRLNPKSDKIPTPTATEELTGPGSGSLVIPHMPDQTWADFTVKWFWRGGGIATSMLVLLLLTYWRECCKQLVFLCPFVAFPRCQLLVFSAYRS